MKPKNTDFLRFAWYFYQATMYQKSEWYFFNQGSIDWKSEVIVEMSPGGRADMLLNFYSTFPIYGTLPKKVSFIFLIHLVLTNSTEILHHVYQVSLINGSH